MSNWVSVKDKLPENGEVVETKVEEEKWVRKEQRLKRRGNLWLLEDGSMYVYYTPTHWRSVS